MTLIRVTDGPSYYHQRLYADGQALCKLAGDAEPSYSLSGMLYASSTGWIMLKVPNALVQGVFAAMDEHGVELPPSGPENSLNAHISVMRPEEVELIGGIDKITERGKRYNYRIGGLVTVTPAGWPEMNQVWMLRVHSPELQALRRSYGLTSLPNNNKFSFHITVAVRRKGVLGRNETSKATGVDDDD